MDAPDLPTRPELAPSPASAATPRSHAQAQAYWRARYEGELRPLCEEVEGLLNGLAALPPDIRATRARDAFHQLGKLAALRALPTPLATLFNEWRDLLRELF